MADTNLGNVIFLYLRPNGGTIAFKKVVCNEELALSLDRDIIEANTKCGVLKAAGSLSSEIPFSGVANFTPAGTELSHNELLDWQLAATKLDWIVSDASTGGTKIDMSGAGYLGSFELTASTDEFISFDCTLAVDGTPVNNL